VLESPEPLIPNEETIEAMKAARRGELIEVDSIDALPSCLSSED
jgi:DNA-damage-inducible protein J